MRRTRIGLLVPATNSTAEPDFHRTVPRNVTVHSHRLWNEPPYDNADAMDRMNAQLESASRHVGAAALDIIAMAGTANSFYKGTDGSMWMETTMAKGAGVPAVASSPSVVQALRFYGVRKVSAATPYPEWDNQRLREYLTTAGFEVLNVDGDPRFTDDRHPQHMNDEDPAEIAEFAISICKPAADAVFCSCSGWRAMEAAPEIERATGRLVVTTNMATIWRTLSKINQREPLPGHGRLLSEMPPIEDAAPSARTA